MESLESILKKCDGSGTVFIEMSLVFNREIVCKKAADRYQLSSTLKKGLLLEKELKEWENSFSLESKLLEPWSAYGSKTEKKDA